MHLYVAGGDENRLYGGAAGKLFHVAVIDISAIGFQCYFICILIDRSALKIFRILELQVDKPRYQTDKAGYK